MKTLSSMLAIALTLLIGAVPLTSVPAHAADAEVAAPKSDAEITAAVEAALAAEPSLKGQKISVTTKTVKGEKEVILTGTVTDQQMMVSAGLAAEKVAGVKYVINEINPEEYLREKAAAK